MSSFQNLPSSQRHIPSDPQRGVGCSWQNCWAPQHHPQLSMNNLANPDIFYCCAVHGLCIMDLYKSKSMFAWTVPVAHKTAPQLQRDNF